MCDHMDSQQQGSVFRDSWEDDLYLQDEIQIFHCNTCDTTFSLDGYEENE